MYFPHDEIVIAPIGLGGSSLLLEVDAKPLDAPGTAFTVPLNTGTNVVTGLAADGEHLHIRTFFGIHAVPRHGCGAPNWTAAWVDQPGGGLEPSHVAIDDEMLFDVTQHTGSLTAFSLDGCGAATCQPVWSATVSGPVGDLAVTAARVYVTSGAMLPVFDADGCGAPTCAPLWSQDQGAVVGPVTPIDRALVFTVDGQMRKLVLPSSRSLPPRLAGCAGRWSGRRWWRSRWQWPRRPSRRARARTSRPRSATSR